MKLKLNVESFVYVAVIILCLITLLLVVASTDQFRDTKNVYQAF